MDSTINFSLKYSDESLTAGGTRNHESNAERVATKQGGQCSSHENLPQPVEHCQECNVPHMQREAMAVGTTYQGMQHHHHQQQQQQQQQGHHHHNRMPNYPGGNFKDSPNHSYQDPSNLQRKLLPNRGTASHSDMMNSSFHQDERPVDFTKHRVPNSSHMRSMYDEGRNMKHYASDQPTDFYTEIYYRRTRSSK